MTYTLRKIQIRSYLGKIVPIQIDRPVGSLHPKDKDILYTVHYGFIPNTISGDGAQIDVHLLGIDQPVFIYHARIIAIIHREDDIEDKLVTPPKGRHYTAEDIENKVHFMEQFFTIKIEMLAYFTRKTGRGYFNPCP